MNVLLKISADVPASPRGPIKVSNVTPKSCDLTWKSSDKDGGLPIIEYIIESSSNDEDWITLGKVDKFKNDFKAKDLEDGKQYVFRVSAINKVGPSKPLLSESIKIQKPPEAPEKPEGPIEVKDIKKESMHVSWQPPKSDGGSPITGYIIEKREQSRNLWSNVKRVAADVTSCMADGLQEGKEYVYRVTAVNKVGQSKALESDTAYKAKSPYGELFLYLIFSPIKM